MDKWQLAKLLYEEGYDHQQVRSVWAYAWNEQHVGLSAKKRKPWQLKALEKIKIEIEDIEFSVGDNGELSNFF